MKFKQFIQEAAVGEEPRYEPHELDKAVDLFLTHCKDAMLMVEENKTLYRGDETTFLYPKIHSVDPTQTERKSQNRPNHYTVLMDNLPSWKGWPKRSRSLICTNDLEYASGFNEYNNAYHIIPFDGVQIGVCPGQDLWDARSFDDSIKFSDLPGMLQSFGMEQHVDWSSFVKFDKALKKDPKTNEDNIYTTAEMYGMPPKYIHKLSSNFLSTLDTALKPKMLGFQKVTTKTLRSVMNKNREVWVGGSVFIMSDRNWYRFRNLVLERTK